MGSLRTHLIVQLFLLVAGALIISECVSCEKLSTVFVLEPADSDSGSETTVVAPNPNDKVKDNTSIITDTNSGNNREPKQLQQQVPKSTSSPKNSQQDQPTSRRLEEESQVAPTSRQKLGNPATRNSNQQQSANSQVPKPKPVANSSDRDQSPSGAPKAEERLLISINTNEDDDDYKPPPPPPKHVGGQHHHVGNGPSDEPPQVHHQHKRKPPSITISIEDANIGKQDITSSSSGGSPAVIVRPSENGQSIVISTGTSSSSSSGLLNNKHPQSGGSINKPAISILTSSSSSGPQSNHHAGGNNREPHRDIEIPVHHQSGSHHTSTTHRPLSVWESLSTMDAAKPPGQNSDERPNLNDYLSSSGGSHRPTSRPITEIRPPVVDTSPYDGANNGPSGFNSDLSSSSSISNELPKYPLNEKNCGLIHETRIVGGDEANPDDFLWMAAIIKSKPKAGEPRPFCGGSLITRRHILTAAHCLENLTPRDVLVRLGSYDFDDATASSHSDDYAIDQFRVPAHYSKKTHVADIAIMRLKTPLTLQDNYKTVCMSQPRRSYVGALGTVTGYGSQSQTFQRAATKLRQVTVPIWENRKCSAVYKKNLTESFLCAGYEEGGKDACQGDSGGPLMTEGPNERMMVVGVVSHGIGCGTPGYPGVYTRTSTYIDWIENNTKE